MTTTVRISWILTALMWIWAWMTWTGAPDQVPLHFGLGGAPTRWGPRSLLSWFGLPGLATLLVLGLGALGRWSTARPGRINIPGKERLARLPGRYHGPVRDAVRAMVGWATLETVVLLGLVQMATVRAAAGGDTRVLIGLVFVLAVLGSPLFVGLALTRTQRALDEAVRRAEADGARDATPP